MDSRRCQGPPPRPARHDETHDFTNIAFTPIHPPSKVPTTPHSAGWQPLSSSCGLTQPTGVNRRSSHPNPLRSNPVEQRPRRSASLEDPDHIERAPPASGPYSHSDIPIHHSLIPRDNRGYIIGPKISSGAEMRTSKATQVSYLSLLFLSIEP
ncbi:hypothetical protein AOQ84DRAFT_47374 [Glonium stellatum]|uniref:Uncharacterized protein n=1 Tax=Glonium stellatum TaxID=574774 RepID=A0A8E2F1C1_9PEZI|nr:hypothetical protein AOQ84DRAFT_47374 [Glonium stellatum]